MNATGHGDQAYDASCGQHSWNICSWVSVDQEKLCESLLSAPNTASLYSSSYGTALQVLQCSEVQTMIGASEAKRGLKKGTQVQDPGNSHNEGCR